MRRLVSLAGLPALLVLVLVPTRAVAAEPGVVPPLSVYGYVVDETATLVISGQGCLPRDAPASVLVTVDRIPDRVFTATPNGKGRWSVQLTIPYPMQGTYVINAECDNYFGTRVYPEFSATEDNLIWAVGATSAGGPRHRPHVTANTGPRTAAELWIGFGAVALGALLWWAGRPRREATAGG